ncbi:MAG TPA: PDZ domain-containing protein [Caulifigura sp.]|nr:PDZ domain-containing protein [Caulifigura sp.]
MRASTRWIAFFLGLLVVVADQAAHAQILYLPTERQTTGRRVRSAFKDSAAPSGAWTVELRRGKKPVGFGVIVSSKGQILAKLSQLESKSGSSQLASANSGDGDSGRLMCQLPGGKVVEGQIVARDEETDLALVKVEAEGLKTAEWNRDFRPQLGRWVVTPNSRGGVSTVGIVSAQTRRIAAERVFGVLGVQLDQVGGTARIMEVFEDSGAKAAGLKVGDVITRCDDKDIADGLSLITRLRRMKPGEEVTLRVKREEKSESIKVTLTHPFGIFLTQFAQQNRMGTTLSQRADGYEQVFSHDGHVDPEECGGPLLDLDGKVIGINIARAGRTETLTLPVEVVEKALERLQLQVKPPASTNVSTENP